MDSNYIISCRPPRPHLQQRDVSLSRQFNPCMVADVQVEGLLPNEQRAALVFNALQKFLFLGCAFTSLCNLQHLWHPSWIQSKVATFHLLLFWLRGALAVNCKVLQTMSRKTMKVPKRFQVPTIPRPTEPLSPPVVAIGVVITL